MKIPECMRRPLTGPEFAAAANKLRTAGLINEPMVTTATAGFAAALLDATERVEALEAEVATAHDHLLAGRTICMDCGGNGFYSVQTGENDYRDDPCTTCHGTCFFSAVDRIAALEAEARELAMQRDDASRRGLAALDERDVLRAEVAALRKVVEAGDALALVTDDIVDDAETPQDRERCESKLGDYRLARAEVTP